jgi:hypothetical protein
MVIWNIAFSIGISIVLASPHVTAAATTTSKAMVSSSLPSSSTKSTVTPYPYQDEDFTIPQVRSRPIRQHIAQSKTTASTKSKLQSSPLSTTTIAAIISNHQWFIVTWTTISIIKVLLHNYISNEKWKNLRIWGDPLLNHRVPTWITHRLVRNTTIASATTPPPNDQDDDDDDCVVVQGDEVKDMVIEEEDDDEEVDPSWTSWADRYHNLLMETTTLREQLDHRTLPVEPPPPPPPQNDEEKEEMIQTIQTMNETLHYWKRVALMKDEQIQRVLQAERQNSIQQLEQLKTDMLRVVEQERAALLLEFQNMMTQLRESISLV